MPATLGKKPKEALATAGTISRNNRDSGNIWDVYKCKETNNSMTSVIAGVTAVAGMTAIAETPAIAWMPDYSRETRNRRVR
jgi:hypothetical protein